MAQHRPFAPAEEQVVGAGTLLSMQRGMTTVSIQVQAGLHQLVHGLSASVLIPCPDT
jgi:hypothetical protein